MGPLQKLFFTFPDGWQGLGLIVVRITVALNILFRAAQELGLNVPSSTSGFAAMLSVLIGVFLFLGFLTPIAGASASLAAFFVTISRWAEVNWAKQFSASDSISLAAISFALVLMGPGAFSVDSRLFGRRQIIIPENRNRSKG